MQPRYVFHHIPKTGGQSIRLALREQFVLVEDYRPAWATGDALNTFVNTQVDTTKLEPNQILCGHWSNEGIHLQQRYPALLINPLFRLFTFVREPFERECSLYRYLVANGQISAKTPPEDRILGGENRLAKRFPCTTENYKQILDRYFFIGLTEQLDESFNVLCHLMDKQARPIPHANKTCNATETFADDLRAAFRERNALDYLIYEECRSRYQDMKTKYSESMDDTRGQ